MKLSAIVITFNEEHIIEDCLRAIDFADEIIVIDSGSTDDTVNICRQFTPNVHITDWPGFGKQRNRALAHATHDWVLTIDADQVVTPALAQEIKQLDLNRDFTAYSAPAQSYYCGKAIKHGAWKDERAIVLFNQQTAKYDERDIHEGLVFSGAKNIGKLEHHLDHYSFINLTQVLDKVNSYSTSSAQMKAKQGKNSSFGKALGHGAWTFIRDYVIKCGFLDGKEGFMLAVSNAEGCYYHYLKLLYLNQAAQKTSPQLEKQT